MEAICGIHRRCRKKYIYQGRKEAASDGRAKATCGVKEAYPF
jgi:hypothetical protein